jgi:hypothetical protein
MDEVHLKGASFKLQNFLAAPGVTAHASTVRQCPRAARIVHTNVKLRKTGASTTTWRQHLQWTGLAWALAVRRVRPPRSYRLPRRLAVLSRPGLWRG